MRRWAVCSTPPPAGWPTDSAPPCRANLLRCSTDADGTVPVEQLLGVRPDVLGDLHKRGVPTRV